jgi:hypothetical protein
MVLGKSKRKIKIKERESFAMKKKKWEVKLRRELKERLFQPRLNRILDIIKDKTPRKIRGRDKRAIHLSLKPLIHKAIRERYKTELNGRDTKSFKLMGNPPSQRKDEIVQKIKKYEKERGKRVHRLIYTLWGVHNECLYVGQTKRGLREIVAKKDSLYKQSVRLKLFLTEKKKLDRLEGIAYHVLAPKTMPRPKFNSIHTKNAKNKCPFCQTDRKIRKEISRALVLVMPKRTSA